MAGDMPLYVMKAAALTCLVLMVLGALWGIISDVIDAWRDQRKNDRLYRNSLEAQEQGRIGQCGAMRRQRPRGRR